MVKLQFEILDSIKLPLVQRFYKQHYPSTKPKRDELIIIARHENSLCAVVRFRSIENYRLLTGMAVDSAMRGQGIGHQLMTFCEDQYLEQTVYCFALDGLEIFYQSHKFRIVEPKALPNCLKVLFERYCNGGKKLTPMQYFA